MFEIYKNMSLEDLKKFYYNSSSKDEKNFYYSLIKLKLQWNSKVS